MKTEVVSRDLCSWSYLQHDANVRGGSWVELLGSGGRFSRRTQGVWGRAAKCLDSSRKFIIGGRKKKLYNKSTISGMCSMFQNT